ncbi:hypothetical protein D3C85_1012570 [compost metagenome]
MKTEKIMQHLIGKTYKEIVQALSIEQDDGDCCGYADVDIIDAVKDLNNADNAILLDVMKIDYNDDSGDGERVVANFIFDLGDEKGLILGYDLSAGSGSGWSYGAFCSLKYNDEEIVSASW